MRWAAISAATQGCCSLRMQTTAVLRRSSPPLLTTASSLFSSSSNSQLPATDKARDCLRLGTPANGTEFHPIRAHGARFEQFDRAITCWARIWVIFGCNTSCAQIRLQHKLCSLPRRMLWQSCPLLDMSGHTQTQHQTVPSWPEHYNTHLNFRCKRPV